MRSCIELRITARFPEHLFQRASKSCCIDKPVFLLVALSDQYCSRPLRTVVLTGDTSSAIAELPWDPLTRLASKPINPASMAAG
jgi:hypothetical protein